MRVERALVAATSKDRFGTRLSPNPGERMPASSYLRVAVYLANCQTGNHGQRPSSTTRLRERTRSGFVLTGD
jgi:hypothetical protein